MPESHRTEISIMLTSDRELTNDEILKLGRDASAGMLQSLGASTYNRGPLTAARFRQFEWPSRRYVGLGESSEWAVTEQERQDYGRDEEEEYDEDDDF